MTEHLLEIKIVQPGRIQGQYHAATPDILRLEKIVYPAEPMPFDVGILPTALTPFSEPILVLVLGGLSHPVNTEMESRLLGAIQRQDGIPMLLVAPTADERAIHCLDELTAEQSENILAVLRRSYPGEWQWRTVEEVEPELHSAALRYREKQSSVNTRALDPSWKPLNMSRPAASFAEVEHYTPAEYTFFELPHRFQHYVNEYLSPDERILYAIRRPAMPSQRNRSWLRREYLQEGVLILTNQRLIHLAELVPPDSANIRYGFHTAVGAVERLVDVSISDLGHESLLLSTSWLARGGKNIIEWEMPAFTHDSLDELAALLEKFIVADPGAYLLRRAELPEQPKKLSALQDSSSSGADSLTQVNERFTASLNASLHPEERVFTWALIPEWMDRKEGARALVVTDRRIFTLPNLSFEKLYREISTLEYTSSILKSSLAINFMENGKPQRQTIYFPYPAQDAFRTCFEIARRIMAVVPLT
jgi:hypothetical protein